MQVKENVSLALLLISYFLLQMHAGAAKAAIGIIIIIAFNNKQHTVEAMSRHLAVEWGPNIRINCIAPGPIERTEGFRRLGTHITAASSVE